MVLLLNGSELLRFGGGTEAGQGQILKLQISRNQVYTAEAAVYVWKKHEA